MTAWHFLIAQTARYCGQHCRSPGELRWHQRVVFLDIDGVLDRRLFGYPCTTAAGIEALSLLNTHKFSIAVDTARSVAEVKEYCQAYSLAGGVAEYGGYIWDAISQQGRPLITEESANQLKQLRHFLQQVPGVFLDDRYQYSVRAFTYKDKARGLVSSLTNSIRSAAVGDGACSPVSPLIVQQCIEELALDRLRMHQTTIDTTIVPKEVDKGSGLVALRDWAAGVSAETIAIGDNEPDLAMFRVASQSFAPSNIGCGRQASLLGCRIARRPYQQGLLEIARTLVGEDGRRRASAGRHEKNDHRNQDVFLHALEVADRSLFLNAMDLAREPAWLQALLN